MNGSGTAGASPAARSLLVQTLPVLGLLVARRFLIAHMLELLVGDLFACGLLLTKIAFGGGTAFFGLFGELAVVCHDCSPICSLISTDKTPEGPNSLLEIRGRNPD